MDGGPVIVLLLWLLLAAAGFFVLYLVVKAAVQAAINESKARADLVEIARALQKPGQP